MSSVAAKSADGLPRFSVVIPTRNEAKDIRDTLAACIAMEYPEKEIIVVDDSSDETPAIVREFSDSGVRLIHREVPENGCCGARRVGMKAARGDVVVLVNADDRPARDFLHRLAAHYRSGADYVVVQSKVQNTGRWIPRFIHCSGRARLAVDPMWSEGFSARRECLEEVGWVPGDYPVRFCRDNLISQRLADAGFRKVLDRTIEMEHISPAELREYWNNQRWRGSFSAPYAFFIHNRSLVFVTAREIAKAARGLFRLVTLFPLVALGVRAARTCRLGFRAALVFTGIAWVQELAQRWGGLQGLLLLCKVRNPRP